MDTLRETIAIGAGIIALITALYQLWTAANNSTSNTYSSQSVPGGYAPFIVAVIFFGIATTVYPK